MCAPLHPNFAPGEAHTRTTIIDSLTALDALESYSSLTHKGEGLPIDATRLEQIPAIAEDLERSEVLELELREREIRVMRGRPFLSGSGGTVEAMPAQCSAWNLKPSAIDSDTVDVDEDVFGSLREQILCSIGGQSWHC